MKIHNFNFRMPLTMFALLKIIGKKTMRSVNSLILDAIIEKYSDKK